MFLPLKYSGLNLIYCSIIQTIFAHKQSQFGVNIRLTEFLYKSSFCINFHAMEIRRFIEKQ